MACELLKIEHLRADVRELQQQAALAAACRAADDHEAEPRWQRVESRHHRTAIGTVATVQLCRAPADARQYVHHRSTAIAAAPAVPEGWPDTRLTTETALST